MSTDTDEQMLTAYRHDAHKMRGRAHAAGPNKIAGVEVNQSVPYGADGDGSALSRPSGAPSQTMDDHDTHYRLSALTGDTRYAPDSFSIQQYRDTLHDLLAVDDAAAMHRHWLNTDIVAAFNESVYYPFTSLKYHTLLVAALVDCYRDGYTFDDLQLAVDARTRVEPYRTVFTGNRFALRITPEQTATTAPLGSCPWRSWQSVWGRLPEHPLDTADSKLDRALDAQLRRISAWSTALQYIEDWEAWRP